MTPTYGVRLLKSTEYSSSIGASRRSEHLAHVQSDLDQ